ncbi:MAG TPA: phosphate ABC transporter permease PstA [Frankiaceae bacterium]|jgi:phosphate transport system permease protein|nr:phosphate ABC transporter permease PstA [Frankiaceae bacterium]
MTTPTLSASPIGGLALSTRRLSKKVLFAIPVACAAVSLLIFAITPFQGRADFLVFFLLTYLSVQTIVSAIVEGRRRAVDRFVQALVIGAFLAAIAPLLSVLGFTIAHGAKRFDWTFFTHSMSGVSESDANGGAEAAIVGTLEQIGIATAIAVPLGLLVSIYLTEYAKGRFGRAVSFFVDVMTGVPSIVAGLFILAAWVLAFGFGYSGFAGSLALTVLMLPTVVRSSEEMLKLVPPSLREGGLALGLTRTRVVQRIVFPAALPGIVTGIMLAIARIAGESAPLLLTVFGNVATNTNPFSGAQSALPLFVFNEAGNNNQTAIDRAWTGALTLIILVMLLNLFARLGVLLLSRKRA